jgi:uncharacterized protein
MGKVQFLVHPVPKGEGMRLKGLVLIAVLCAAATALGQDRASSTAPNTVYVGADGKFEANPDTAVMQFNISAQESTARAAYDRATKDAEQVREILRSNGIDPRTAEISYYSIAPVEEYQEGHSKLVGYQVNSSVTLKLKDFSKVAPIIQQLADADITAHNSVSYTLENIEAAKRKAVEDAYRRARDLAEALASASGRTLGPLTSATIDISENLRVVPVRFSMARMAAQTAPAPTQEFSPQTVSITAHVNATFALK